MPRTRGSRRRRAPTCTCGTPRGSNRQPGVVRASSTRSSGTTSNRHRICGRSSPRATSAIEARESGRPPGSPSRAGGPSSAATSARLRRCSDGPIRSCLPPPSRRAPILLDLGVLHEREGRYEEALTALRQAEGFGRAAGDIGTVARAVARRQFVRSHVEDTAQSELQAEAEALLPELETLGDDMAIAEICYFV